MKSIILAICSLFMYKSCDSQSQTDLKETTLTYTTFTRGFYKQVVIKNQQITISLTKGATDMVAKPISSKNWKSLVTEFQKIKLDNLPKLVAPSNRSSTDAALFASLKVKHQNKNYDSTSFDHGNAPAEIKKLVELITKLSE
jgi:hypothetical protein